MDDDNLDPEGPQPRDESEDLADLPAVEFADFVAACIRIRRERRLLRPDKFFHAEPLALRADVPNVLWFGPDGQGIPPEAWHDADGRISVMLNGDGERSLVMILNPNGESEFTVPPMGEAPDLPREWRVVVDCATGEVEPKRAPVKTGDRLPVGDRTLILLESTEVLQ